MFINMRETLMKSTAPVTRPRVVRLPEAIATTGLGRSSIYSLMKRGAFPQSVKLSERAVGWHESDLNAWLESRPSAA
jgi:prophage regulatory protein